MANETMLTIVGNLTADPEIRFLANGVALTKFAVASTPRVYDRAKGEYGDGEPLFVNCTAWRTLAENIAESLTRGTRVVVTGRLKQSRWETPDGEKRSAYGLDVEEIGPSLRFAQTSIKKLARTNGNGHIPTTPPEDPWTSASTSRTDAGGFAGDDAPPF